MTVWKHLILKTLELEALGARRKKRKDKRWLLKALYPSMMKR